MKGNQLLSIVMVGVGLGWSSSAWAACDREYSPQQLTADLGAMSSALRALDEDTFRRTGKLMEESLPCINRQLPTAVYASMYRYIGAYHYLEKDYQIAGRWFRTALELDPTYEWDVNDLGPSHPLRSTFDAQRSTAVTEPEVIEGMDVNPPAGAKLILDGRPLTEPGATAGRPHLLQIISDADQSVMDAFLIEGAAIPDAYLKEEAAAVVVEEPSRRDRRDRNRKPNVVETGEIAYGDISVIKVEAVRSPAKTPMLIAGGAGLLIGGGLYAASFATRSQFDAATTTDELLQAQSVTNSLVVASGSLLAIGVGVGYAGVMMGDSPGVFFGRRF